MYPGADCFPVACRAAQLSFTSSPKVRLPGSHQTSQLLREDGRVSHLSLGLSRLTAQKILRGSGSKIMSVDPHIVLGYRP